MDIRFRHHNSHLEAPDLFRNLDPQLRAIQGLVLQHRPELLQRLPRDRLVGAPKKARKLMFSDPFIHHAVRAWLEPVSDPFSQQIGPSVKDTVYSSRLVEAVAVTHAARFWPTYYIKAQGEVDLACIAGNRFWPIEIKWSKTIRPKDLKQLAKYPEGRILGRSRRAVEILGLPAIPLPLALLAEDGTGMPFAAYVSEPYSHP